MEEDGGVKAPVTRLRRRLSVETDDTKSPSAPSTPNKKRGGRLAAKPQLELIDEDTITNSPKRTTRKSIARDITEPEEKSVTPARRSTRAKSNTSLVSEAEEKVLTPARRSTRIKSNTSVVSEATQSVDSPRAKRAVARRNSQVGSDTEASVTPARTRRTRKGSTSSIDKEGTPSVSESALTPSRTRRTRKGSTSSETPAETAQEDKPSSLITEVISEEPEENKLRKSTSETDNVENRDDSPSTRKSPRLMAKKGRRSKSEDSNEIESQSVNDQNDNALTAREESSQNTNATVKVSQNDMLSISSANLIMELDTKPKKKSSDKNKSASDIEVDSKSKRHRTKSWTTLCATPPNEGNFFSDNESTTKKIKKHGKIFNDKRLSDTGSGDGIKKSVTENKSILDEDTEIIFNTSKNNRRSKNKSFITNKSAILNESMNEIPKAADTSNESNKENLLGVAPAIKDSSTELFDKAPNTEIKSMVFIEDSDSNTGSLGKHNDNKQLDDDQCVPFVLHPSENQITSSKTSDKIPSDSMFTANAVDEIISVNQSCEPMDVDETLPDNVSMSAFTNEDKLNKSRRKSSLCIASEADSSTKESKNKSKRKSLLSNSTIQTKECTENGHKNNLEQSQAKIEEEDKHVENSRKSSLCIQDEVDSSFKEIANKSKRKSSKSNLEEIENINKSTLSQSQIKDSSEENVHNKKSRKSSLNLTPGPESISKNNSKRKSSMSHSTSEDLEKTENKTTLVLSQIKDISAADNNVSKSPQVDSNELSRTKDRPVNKNLSINYTTSTPVQKKNMEKLGMQMNTSVITPNNESKTKIKSNNTPKKCRSITSKSSANSSEENLGMSEEESSEDRSNLLDDEAEEASDDYESGDSQDEEERQYERENEIREKGETLTSEDEISNDSDYEKDSFIVSSDQEDYELLVGSGDDLDMSDNELTMTAKSKKKYNERKIKEQKKASREMYEARHKNESDKSSEVVKSKKNNRNRLDSTLLESGDEISMPPKKNKRMRLESTLETSQIKSDTEEKETKIKDTTMSDTEEIGRKKKKSKRLSESVCNESVMNEKEITICNEETIEKDDPLLINVKIEPKTPQKELEISTVHFTDRADIEQIQVCDNLSMMKTNETSDPLEKTMTDDVNGEDSDYSISENEEITNNYDSVLKDLNNENKSKQIKSHDISLNLNKKNKKKPKDAIVEELNLTQTKKSKKKVQDTPEQSKEKTVKRVFKKLAENDDMSSDSIDLKLLFSDESNDSSEKKFESVKTADVTDSFIPLRHTPGKTNILKPPNTTANDSLLNNSNKQKNKESVKSDENEDSNTNDDGEQLHFFIDTKGDLSDSESSTKESLNTSSKKNIGNDVKPADEDGDNSDEAPVETSYLSEKSKKRNKKTSVKLDTSITEKSLNSTLTKTPKSEKKITISESQEIEVPENEIPKTPASQKKKNKLSMSCEKQTTILESPTSMSKTPTVTSEKKKKKVSESHEAAPLETVMLKTPSSEKKKNKLLYECNANPIEISESAISVPKTPLSAKKKKISESREEATVDIPEPITSEVKTPSTDKKQKRLSESVGFKVENLLDSTKVANEGAMSAKKRKRKSSAHQTSEEIIGEDTKVLNISGKLNESIGNKKKKQKISETKDDLIPEQATTSLNIQVNLPAKEENNSKKANKNKRKNLEENMAPTAQKPVTDTKVSKKRKERDDDDSGKRSKVFKEHSLDKIHVPRLPPSLINQLDDKPKAELLEMKKAKLVATTDFVVEETRRKRNKPSNFLEESVYLNEDDKAPVAKKKEIVKKPKVLPFLPTVSTSDSGFTTNFQVNVLSQTMEFVAKRNEMPHFKEDYLNNRKIKKLRTYDLYKKHRNVKLSKL